MSYFCIFFNIILNNAKIEMVIYMIGERLSDIRFDANLTQIDMAKKLKTSQANYSRWESNKELIPLKKLNLLCNYFYIFLFPCICRII